MYFDFTVHSTFSHIHQFKVYLIYGSNHVLCDFFFKLFILTDNTLLFSLNYSDVKSNLNLLIDSLSSVDLYCNHNVVKVVDSHYNFDNSLVDFIKEYKGDSSLVFICKYQLFKTTSLRSLFEKQDDFLCFNVDELKLTSTLFNFICEKFCCKLDKTFLQNLLSSPLFFDLGFDFLKSEIRKREISTDLENYEFLSHNEIQKSVSISDVANLILMKKSESLSCLLVYFDGYSFFYNLIFYFNKLYLSLAKGVKFSRFQLRCNIEEFDNFKKHLRIADKNFVSKVISASIRSLKILLDNIHIDKEIVLYYFCAECFL